VDVVYIRLDKYLSDMGIGTRSEVKRFIRNGRVCVGESKIKKGDFKVSKEEDKVFFDGKSIKYVDYEYYMLNKPAGVVSATRDNISKTVIDLIENAVRIDLFPVGRLDKDTEGLLIITNDGDLAHRLLSPKNHIGKVYYAKIDGLVTQEDINLFSQGVQLDENTITLPAQLKILKSSQISEIELTIFEGKFHQVKRMFEAVDKQVIYLKRLSLGDLWLDNNLEIGQYRSLEEKEVLLLKEQ
jgi:16S rRNA pseudouridine516 synthase